MNRPRSFAPPHGPPETLDQGPLRCDAWLTKLSSFVSPPRDLAKNTEKTEDPADQKLGFLLKRAELLQKIETVLSGWLPAHCLRQSKVSNFKEGILVLQVSHALYARILYPSKESILKKLRETMPSLEFKALKIQIQPRLRSF